MFPTRVSTRPQSVRPFVALLVAALLAAATQPAAAQSGSPCAPVEQGLDRSYDSGDVSRMDVALFAAGDGIAVWAGRGSGTGDGSRQAVFGQRINADGTGSGPPFLINTVVTDQDQFEPAVAAAPDGRFVAVWTSDVSDGGDNESSSIRARVYRANGTAVGPDFQVNSSVFGTQKEPDVAMAEDGSFVAVWFDDSDAPGSSQMNGREIRARRFNANGTALGPDFVVNDRTTGIQSEPAIGARPGGGFVVVFKTSTGSPGNDSGASIQARLFAANGSPVAGQFQVNDVIDGAQSEPAVAVDPDGTFLVVWKSPSTPGNDQENNSIQARGYTSTGAAVGLQKQVNTETQKDQFDPVVAAAGGREFLIAWLSRAVDDRVKARAWTLESQPLGTEFEAGGFGTTRSFLPTVGGNGNGQTIVLFERDQQVRGQAYLLPCVNSGGLTDCVQDDNTLCLTSDRFQVTAVWRDRQNLTGQGNAIELTPDTGYFWFFDSANVETVVKVLDACGFGNRFWVFIGGLTDLNVEFEVEDVETGVIRRYENPLGSAFLTVNDTNAFDTCP